MENGIGKPSLYFDDGWFSPVPSPDSNFYNWQFSQEMNFILVSKLE